MRVLLLFLFTLSQQPVPIGPDEAIGFDYEQAEITRATVTHFESQWDGQTWVSLGIPPMISAGAPVGWNTYKVVPPFTSGTHTAAFRACNISGCGGGSVPFAFVFPSSPAGIPSNVRKVPR